MKDLFFSCRSAIRSQAGLGVIEFLLPLLVLDSICFGDASDKNCTVNELQSALFTTIKRNTMKKVELQKSIALVFMVIDTLKAWSEHEVEDRHSSMRGSSSSSLAGSGYTRLRSSNDSCWSADESIAHIEDLMKLLPLSLCAKAAAQVGMHARSLMFLEMDARQKCAEEIYDGVIRVDNHVQPAGKNKMRKLVAGKHYLNGIDIALAQRLFGELNDCDSMAAISHFLNQSGAPKSLTDRINERETYGDWDGVLRGYEQASQIMNASDKKSSPAFCDEYSQKDVHRENTSIEISHMRALLELGQLESALNQAKGILSDSFGNYTKCYPLRAEIPIQFSLPPKQIKKERLSQLVPYAVEASWRLSRWDILDQLLTDPDLCFNKNRKLYKSSDLGNQYQISIGKAMLGLHQRNEGMVTTALNEARESVMSSLSAAAQENYSRAFPHLLKLHCLREIEDASVVLCMKQRSENYFKNFSFLATSDAPEAWDWRSRLGSTGPDITASIHIINVRLALSRLASESTLEGLLWLTMGKKARKSGLYHMAENALAHAHAVFIRGGKCCDSKYKELLNSGEYLQSYTSEISLQVAKIKYQTGKSTAALQILEQEDIQHLLNESDENVQHELEKIIDKNEMQSFARRTLQATEWIMEDGLKSGSEVMARYRLLVKNVVPKWERGEKYLLLDQRTFLLKN